MNRCGDNVGIAEHADNGPGDKIWQTVSAESLSRPIRQDTVDSPRARAPPHVVWTIPVPVLQYDSASC